MNGIKGKIAVFLKLNNLWVMVSMVTMLISISGVVIITALMNNRFDELIDYSTQQHSRSVVESVAASIDTYLYGMLTTFDSIEEGILRHDSTALPKFMADFFQHRDINTIVLFDENANVLADLRNSEAYQSVDFQQQEWFQSAIIESGGYFIGTPKVQRIYEKEYPWVISLSKTINPGGLEDGRLVVLMDLNLGTFGNLCSFELGRSGYLYILGPEMEIIYHPFQQIIYAGIIKDDIQAIANMPDGESIVDSGGKRISVSSRTLNTTDWRVIGVSPLIGFFSYSNELSGFINILIITTVLLITASAMIISLLLTRPIRKLMMMMRHVESGSFEKVYQIKGVYEVRELSRSFIQMVHKVEHLMGELRKEQEQILSDQVQLSKIEMKLLHAQLNPHFLYNTLDSVVWLAESGDQKNVVKMTEALSNYFRLTLAKGDEVIPLENELKHTENYLIIQKMRYNEQFDYSIKNELGFSDYMTLKNIIQPIVENSILHGVANMLQQCLITVRAYSQDNHKLIIEVSDNGCGIKPSILENILSKQPGSKSGIGIHNVNKRIQLMYGKEFGLEYESEPDVGTTVKIILPLGTVRR